MKKKSKLPRIFKTKEDKDYSNQINELYKQIINNQLVFGNTSVLNFVPETKEEKISRLKIEIEERQKELHSLEFKDKINEIIND